MKKIEKFDRQIPVRNYFIVLTVSVVIIILTLYLRAFYLNYDAYKQSGSYFAYQRINEITKDDFDFIISEATDNILFIGYNSNDMYKFEKKLYKELKKKNMLDKLLYWNVNDYLKNDKYIEILKSKFANVEINKAPSIIIIKSGLAIGSYKVDDNFFKEKDIEEIFERN